MCKQCGGGSICQHGRIRSRCKDCGGSEICEHGRHKFGCRECGGSSFCELGPERKRLFCSCTDVEAERSHQPSAYNQRVRGRMEGGLVGLLAASIVFGVLLWVAFDTVAPEEAR